MVLPSLSPFSGNTGAVVFASWRPTTAWESQVIWGLSRVLDGAPGRGSSPVHRWHVPLGPSPRNSPRVLNNGRPQLSVGCLLSLEMPTRLLAAWDRRRVRRKEPRPPRGVPPHYYCGRPLGCSPPVMVSVPHCTQYGFYIIWGPGRLSADPTSLGRLVGCCPCSPVRICSPNGVQVQLYAVDHSAHASMKSAASCVN